MTTLQLALSELKRMTRGTLPKLALIAVTCVPLLYGALYLYRHIVTGKQIGRAHV